MGRIRTIKPGFFRSESLSRCSLEARITFAGLWTEADDQGRGDATPRLIATSLWPWDNPSDEQVASWLAELAATEHIAIYQHRGKPVFQVLRWDDHQSAAYRRGTSNYPAPPENPTPRTSLHDSARSVVQESAGTEQTGLEGKGVEGEQIGQPTDDVVGQSVAIYAEHVYALDPSRCKQIPSRYKAGIAKNAIRDHGDELLRYMDRHPNATAQQLAEHVLGVRAPGAVEAPAAPEWHYDPTCPDHDPYDGMQRLDDSGHGQLRPCHCRRTEPYPVTLATVTELRAAQ